MEERSGPMVAIVGRPNVGKSSLFNRLIEQRRALVHREPGMTRDRIYGQVEWIGREFAIVDTGGLEPGAAEPLKNLVERQVQFAIEEALLILFVVDGPAGLNPLDEHIGRLLRKTGKNVIVAVNKIDDHRQAALVSDFFKLGFGEPIWVSAIHGKHVGELLDEVVGRLSGSFGQEEIDSPKRPRIAMVGKPNAGKSTLANSLLGQDRLLVHTEPGTTRDAVTVPFSWHDRGYALVDTAGVRRRSKMRSPVERLSVIMASKALSAAHVAVLVLDAERGLDNQDKRVAGWIQDAKRPCVLAVNKWDVIEDKRSERAAWLERLSEELPFLSFCPRVFVSGLTRSNLNRLMEAIDRIDRNRSLFVQASRLTAMAKEAAIVHQPPSRGGKKLAFYYVSQLKNRMATFVFKVNDARLLHFSYERYLENTFRKVLGFEGIPMTFLFVSKERKNR